MSAPTATVFDVQRFSVHDGPGIRTVVFFKGCSLRCRWCQNPEGIRAAEELAYYEDRCLAGCAACVPACGERALGPSRSSRVAFDLCTACGDCLAPCPSGALRIAGRRVEVGELLAEALRDRTFYQSSGGGLTLSGGEAVLQSEFLEAFLPAAKGAGLHVVLETAGHYPFSLLEPLLPHLDRVLFDLKLADAAAHEAATGSDNARILANLRVLLGRGTPVEARMPVVPGINDAPGHLEAMGRLLTSLGLRALALLRYNALWEAKLPRLSRAPSPLGISARDDAYYEQIRRSFAALGIAAAL